ncbi:hypothetical protein ADK60_41015 [Streptomyces sp. XY431]|uniref:hypothetical protein n=1 Tax=Streptomyces sp. XY431 TaxID=1415562 RepID=UPI0006AF6534|nr:hypothetical protein [Streptomyces sp. XY431]KOV09519.1 hypothetical protein ADK60_41015 [Streptomyces sp. XY431]
MNHRTDPTEDRLAAELAAGLTALADSPAPFSRTDTAWAVRQGRSRLRRRRLGVLGAVTAVALGASVLGATLPDRGTAGPQKAATGPATPDPVLPGLGPDTGRDPLTIAAAFGWLPDGFTGTSYTIGFTGAPTLFSGKADGPPQTGPDAQATNHQTMVLSILPGSGEPAVGTDNFGQQQYRVDARPVNGRPAYWVGRAPGDPAGTGHDYRLRWQAAEGYWVELGGIYLRAADGVVDMMLKIADRVTTGPQAVRLPFKVQDIPADVTQVGVSLYLGTAAGDGYPWSAHINYQSGDNHLSLDARPAVGPVPPTSQPEFQRVTAPPTLNADANSEVSNEPSTGSSSAQMCTDTRGVRVCATTWNEAAFTATGGLARWVDRLVPLGTDRSVWTTEVTP